MYVRTGGMAGLIPVFHFLKMLFIYAVIAVISMLAVLEPDLAEKMKAEAEGIFLWALEGLQRLVANNFKFTESDRIRENREAVKRDNNNIFDFMESEGYIRRKADASISSKDFYEIYRMWCEENSLAPLKARSFSDAMIANAMKFNLEHCNNITAVARPNINGFYDVSPCTYVPEEWQD